MKPRLLIVDDDEDIRTQMKWALAEDYEILLAEDRPGALEIFNQNKTEAVLLDLGLPPHPGDPEEGLAALSELLGVDPLTKVIIISGQTEKENALRAIGDGAYDFQSKPVQIDELKVTLKRAFHVARLERDYLQLRSKMEQDTFEGMLGTSPQMQQLFETIRKVATADAPVLLLGESGTGKEMTALALHRRSPRKEEPFIAINCGAIPENLLESELFGHEKGSFTGAHAQRKGRIESAAGGTLFLDEIGELSLGLQVKLLRFLQEQQIERIGGRTTINVDARVIAATNSDLKKVMESGGFREDLYFRLAVIVIPMPALRERQGDISLLGQVFLNQFSVANRKKRLGFNQKALQAMEQHAWPGNVRELENRVKRAVIMAEGTRVTAEDLELSSSPGQAGGRTLKEAREELEREMVQAALQKNRGKISRAATELGVSRPTLYELMEKLGISRSS